MKQQGTGHVGPNVQSLHNGSHDTKGPFPLADRLRKLEEQQARINAEIQRVRRWESQEERKRDTHHKILLGPMMLERVGDRKTSEKWAKAELDRFLKREQDRALFGLSPKAFDGSQPRRT